MNSMLDGLTFRGLPIFSSNWSTDAACDSPQPPRPWRVARASQGQQGRYRGPSRAAWLFSISLASSGRFERTLHELEALQARRRGQITLLARLDVQGIPGN